jgi:PKD repeat protein
MTAVNRTEMVPMRAILSSPRRARLNLRFASKLLWLTLMFGAAGICITAAVGGERTAPSQASGPAGDTAAATGAPGVPRFISYPSPPGIGDDSGEPTVGVNWKSAKTFSNSMFDISNGGTVNYYGGLSSTMLRITFDDCPSPANALWEEKPLVLSATPRAAGDPILFTDSPNGRTLVSQLEGLTPAGRTIDITDDDGETFQPSEGSSLPSDLDHQTIGGGPFHAPLSSPLYPHAIYYASQSVGEARAAVSLDGGRTFGPGSVMYTVDQCAGLHGHIKVSPADGTAYVPNMGCGGAVPFHETGAKQAVIVSEDNGLTWNIRPIPDSTTHGNGATDNSIIGTRDPSVSIDPDGTDYFVYQAEDDLAGETHPKVAVSHDKGATWAPSVDVGAAVLNGGRIRNATFVTATAGGSGRAAVAFFGTETGGNNWACGEGDDCSLNAQGVPTGINARPKFTGVWYLYVSVTYDGGQTWTTQNVTPGDPIQRGGICGGGTCRNLLDFIDIQIDKEGRVVVAGEDGCIGACVTGGPNSFSAKAFVTRQTGGKRLFAQFDPTEPSLAGAPGVRGTMNPAKTQVNLTWDAPDAGGSVISGYKIYRRIGSGAFVLLANVPQTSFTDTTFDPNSPVAYRVTAVNGIGEGPYCHEFVPEIGPPLENVCVAPGLTLLTDAIGDTSAALGIITTPAGPGMDLISAQLAQPVQTDGIPRLVFRINTDPGTEPQPPGSAWYVSMKTPDGKVRGVEMRWAGTSPTFSSYIAETNTSGTSDGRFVDPASVKPAEPGSHYDAALGVIEIIVKASDLGLAPGATISGFNSAVTQTSDPAGVGAGATATYDEMPDGLAYQGSYVVGANEACLPNQPPVAVLAASPTEGNSPLTVNFTAAGSTDADAGDTIASYTFSFGDGSADVTQPGATITHTYTRAGVFFATLKVTDSRGKEGANIASVVIKTPAVLQNISTRARVLTGDQAAIGGFIITGNAPKKVIIRGIGPSLRNGDVPFAGRLEDPTLELFDGDASIAFNDNWKESQQTEVEQSGVAPTNDQESAIVRTLNPGLYTAVLRGKNDTTGTGLVEIYDIDRDSPARVGNLSTRGAVQTGNDVLIGGFIVGPSPAGAARIVVRAIAPSYKDQTPEAIDDPTLEVRNPNGDLIAENDNWKQTQQNDIQATGLAPSNDNESAILFSTLEPSSYTAIVRGKNGAIGLGSVEIYNLP